MPARNSVKPMPFPGESPTVSLAMAAGDKFGFHEEKKPARKGAKASSSANPRKAAKRSAAKKKPAGRAGAARRAR